MEFNPNSISREHVLKAIAKIKQQDIELIPSTRWNVIIEGENYPPKEIMRHAHEQMNGLYIWKYGGGDATNRFLEEMGFEVVEKKEDSESLESLLRKRFNNIWRCADSYKWQFLKDTNLLTFDWINQDINYREIDLNTLPKGKKALKPWINDLRIGDLIFVMGKNNYNGIAIAKSTYNFSGPFVSMGDSGNKPAIEIEYIHKLESVKSHNLQTHNNPTTFAKIDQYSFGLGKALAFLAAEVPDALFALKNYLESNPTMKNGNMNKLFGDVKKYPLNQILYGPPGTGKTYNTINKALEIIGEEAEKNLKWDDRESVKKQFDKRLSEGRILFTTFHQSMTYEDFIEGIKPIVPEREGDSVSYKIEDGIFKRIADKARNSKQNNFEKAYKSLLLELVDSKDEMIKLKTKKGNEFGISINRNANLTLHTGPDFKKQGTLTKENLEKQINGYEVFDGWDGYFTGVINYLKEKHSYREEDMQNPNFVLIIDEINRGNVSQIFGELITLIEEDKRIGKAEGLELVLPYSKKKFGVPANLYIIGTMNTADRSVEALDTALRRRFSFMEMLPKPELIITEGKLKEQMCIINGIDLSALLIAINNRIEILLDKDHMIGHSFFMSVVTLRDLKIVFQNKIVPLLQEYFFGDYGKIGLILGKGFFIKNGEQAKVNETFFAAFDDYDLAGLSDKPVYHLKNVGEMGDDEFLMAIDQLEL